MQIILEMSSKIILLIILLSTELSNAQTPVRQAVDSSEKFKGFDQLLDRFVLANKNLENFNRVLNFVVNHSEFQPLVLSIGYFGSNSKILDQVTEFLNKRILDHYRFDLEKLARKAPNLQKGLTWIILVDEFHNLDIHVHGDTNVWNAANKFLILFIGKKDNEPTNEWIDLFRTLWNRHGICKILIASINDNLKYLYTYSPFDKSNDKFGVVQRLDVEGNLNCTVTTNIKNVESEIQAEKCLPQEKPTSDYPKLFEDFRDFNEYPVNITIFESLMMNITTDENNKTTYTLLDANVMNLIQERLRSKFRINVLEVHDVGDPFEEALNTIARGGASELVFTGYFTKRYWRDFDFTASVFQDKLCLIAPSSKQVPKFLMPFLPFTKELWFLLIVYNLCVAFLWSLIHRIESTFRSKYVKPTTVPVDVDIQVWKHPKPKRLENIRLLGFEDYPGVIKCGYFKRRRSSRASLDYSKPYDEPPEIHSCLIGSFDILTVACYPLYGGKTSSERAFLIGSLFVALILIGLYQSCLVSSLSKPIYYPELNSLLDVAQSNRTIITKYKNLQENTFPELSPKDSEPIIDKLRKMTVISTSHEKTYDMVAYRGFVSLGRFSSFELENLTEYYDDEGRKLLLHMVKECPATYALSYVGRLFSPYLQRIDSLLLRMQQAGFIVKWYDEMLFRVKVQLGKSIPRPDEDVKLTLEHLSLSFLGLGIGLFCSTIVFLGELRFARKLRCSISSNHHLTSSYIHRVVDCHKSPQRS